MGNQSSQRPLGRKCNGRKLGIAAVMAKLGTSKPKLSKY